MTFCRLRGKETSFELVIARNLNKAENSEIFRTMQTNEIEDFTFYDRMMLSKEAHFLPKLLIKSSWGKCEPRRPKLTKPKQGKFQIFQIPETSPEINTFL